MSVTPYQAHLALQSEAEQGEAVALVQQARTLFDLDRHLEGREGVQQVDEAFMLLVAAAVSAGGTGGAAGAVAPPSQALWPACAKVPRCW